MGTALLLAERLLEISLAAVDVPCQVGSDEHCHA